MNVKQGGTEDLAVWRPERTLDVLFPVIIETGGITCMHVSRGPLLNSVYCPEMEEHQCYSLRLSRTF